MKCLPFSILFNSFSTNSWKFGPVGHLPLSKLLWKEVVKPGDLVIDATAGNGHDSLCLAKLALTSTSGYLHCIDIQKKAISSTKEKLQKDLPAEVFKRIDFHCQSHESFPAEISKSSASLICYNLGYLPENNRNLINPADLVITRTESTLKSLDIAMSLVKETGLISVTCYRGHRGNNVFSFPDYCF
jgi:tRNA1(Val) A37 N6-methylase TrmN6